MTSPFTERPDRRAASKDSIKLVSSDMSGRKPSNEDPKTLPLKSIKLSLPLFQPRDSLIYEWNSNKHIDRLADILKRDPTKKKMLEPIKVMSFGSQWYLIDGHHRLAAYRKANYDLIAVEAIHSEARGVDRVLEAQKAALMMNVRDKLPMTSEDKSNAAWRLIATERPLTAKEIEEITQLSERTIRGMRATFRKLRETISSESLIGYSWARARMESSGASIEDIEEQERNERDALHIAKKLRKHFDNKLVKNPEITKRALAIYDPRLPELLGFTIAAGSDQEQPDPS